MYEGKIGVNPVSRKIGYCKKKVEQKGFISVMINDLNMRIFMKENMLSCTCTKRTNLYSTIFNKGDHLPI